MSVITHGAHLAGASALAHSLQLGATRAGSLDPAIAIMDGCESSYAPAKAPLFFSEGDGGGSGSSKTLPGELAQNIKSGGTDSPAVTMPGSLPQHAERARTDTPAPDAGGTVLPNLRERKELMGLRDGDNAMTINQKISIFTVGMKDSLDLYKAQDTMMEHLDQFHRAFDCFDPLFDDANADIAFHAVQFISQTLMTYELADAIYPQSQMTYRGRFLKRASEAWNRGIIPATEKVSPMVDLVRSLGTDRNALPESATVKLSEIAVSQDMDEFPSLVKAISAEATSGDIDRSTSAALAFVLSARLLEEPLRLESMTNTFLRHVEWNAHLFRDKANYWTPMGAISDVGNLIDDPTMYMEFIKTLLVREIDLRFAYAVPAVFQLAAHLEDEGRVEMLATMAGDQSLSVKAYLSGIVRRVREDQWKFTKPEQAIVDKAAQVFMI